MKKIFANTQKDKYFYRNYAKSCLAAIGIIIVIIFVYSALFHSNPDNHPEFNVTSVNIEEGIDTFSVTGYIELLNYDCEMVLINAIAVDNKGQYIYLADEFYINGDGEYSFAFWGYYLDSGTYIEDVKDFVVRER